MHILWIILIRFVAGVIAKLITSGVNEPQGPQKLFSSPKSWPPPGFGWGPNRPLTASVEVA
jgi:hypothetical protein